MGRQLPEATLRILSEDYYKDLPKSKRKDPFKRMREEAKMESKRQQYLSETISMLDSYENMQSIDELKEMVGDIKGRLGKYNDNEIWK
ncbi:hypothetical protein ACWA2C_16660 [Priestia megaterium]